ncbi:hypothetical protein IW148_005415 [Coemansia sp. RSA 1199]|nr:hypothetical protein IW148_005415 [Coemansia sp. RSA 1199]
MQKRKTSKPILRLGQKRTHAESTRESVFAKDVFDQTAEWTKELADKEASDKRKRNEAFLEELKHGQERAKQGRATEKEPGLTTNLHISGLHPSVNEHTLCVAFGRFGPLGSVKVMWPRDTAAKSNCGFVSFMEREGAEQARREMDGSELCGLELRVVWAKHVALPSEPGFVQGAEQTGHPFNARGTDSTVLEVRVARPTNKQTERLIHWTVEHVVRFGAAFECMLVQHTHSDERFGFLTQWASNDHVYYRWRMYSLLNHDTKQKWHSSMFVMYDEGPVWEPPTRVDVELQAENELQSESGVRSELSRRARQKVERCTRIQTSERGSIARAMVVVIDHAYAAAQVVGIVCQALYDARGDEKLARLMLISDVLHNSAAQVANAWRLRDQLELQLSNIFDDLARASKQIEGRLRAEHFRKRVLSVLAVWEARMIFPLNALYEQAAKFI